jgi:dTDP-4-amino-4,6-dideoxygalactose transaminase
VTRFLGLGVPIIEDCAQSIGGTHGARRLGSFGQAALFSFYATKMIAAGAGGMAVTTSPELADRIRDLKSYDKKSDHRLRFNYQLTDLQAAVGRVQLAKLERFISRRRGIARGYRAAFQDLPVRLPPDDAGHIYFRYVLDTGADCSAVIRQASERGIGCARPVHTPLHRLIGQPGFPHTEKAWRQCLSIPIYPSLTRAEQERVIDVVSGLLNP